MCGRYTQRKPGKPIARYYGLDDNGLEIVPRFNIAPTQRVIAVINGQEGLALTQLKWGLIPAWAKEASIGSKLINARAETLAEKPSFRNALKQRRCLIPADGWYEWRAEGKAKQPYFFHRRDDGLFSFAGLWEQWRTPEGETLATCTIITTEPNELAAQYHTRMPAILKRTDERFWLDADSRAPDLVQLLQPCPSDELEVYAVSRAVNAAGKDEPSFVEPMPLQV